MIGVDSTLLIDVMTSRDKKVLEAIEALPEEEMCTSEMVVYEVYHGIFSYKKNAELDAKKFEALLDTFAMIYPIDQKASVLAARISGKLSREGKMISKDDALIAASLLANGCTSIVTRNVRDFSKIKELKVIAY